MGSSSLFQNFQTLGGQYAILGNEFADGGKNSSRESLNDTTTTDQRGNKMYGGRFSGGGQNQQYQQQNQQNRNYNRQGSNQGGQGRNRGSRSLHSPTANYNNKPQFGGGSSSRQNNRQNQYQQPPQSQYKSDLPMKSATLPRKFTADDGHSDEPQQMPSRPKVTEQDLITDPAKVQSGILNMVSNYTEGKLSLNQALDSIQEYKVTQKDLFEIFNVCLDRNEKTRQSLTEILTESINQQSIDLADMKNALKELFDFAADLLVDYPKLYQYIAQFISLPLHKGLITLNDLSAIAETEINAKNGHTVLKEIFTLVEHKYQQSLCQICKSNDDLAAFLGEKDVQEFFKENVSSFLFYFEVKDISIVSIHTILKRLL